MSRTSSFVFDDIARVYDETRSLPPDVMEKVVHTLAKMLQGTSTLLDIGVGTGRYALPLSARGICVTGLDISMMMMRRAALKGCCNLVRGDAALLPFKNRTFDAALMVHVLHLIPNWQGAVAEVARVVRTSLLTVTTYREPEFKGRVEYIEMVERSGYGPAFPGKHEREMAEITAPDETIEIHRYKEEIPAHHLIGRIERREYSWATKLPDEQHSEAVERIRARWEGRTHKTETTIKIHRWERERLKAVLMGTES
ncbi:MAG: class I SAM-dependent methyltransferase [Candidatus Thermoplasmatota archaeon]